MTVHRLCNLVGLEFLGNLASANLALKRSSLLNDESSFDYNWFKTYYKLDNSINLKDSYKYFTNSKNKLNIGNNIPLMLKTHSTSLPDGMIEHSIERIWDGLLSRSKKEYIVI